VRGYVYDESGQVISMLIAGSPLRYEEIIWLDNTPIGRVESSTSAVTAVHVIHSDHLNTPRALANAQTQGGQAAGTVVWRWKLNQQTATGSNAFGAQPAEEDPDGNGTSVRFDLRFPGQQYDAATGMHYNYFRDYEPGTRRYVESDAIGLRGGLSTYSYSAADRVSKLDPLGLMTVCKRVWRSFNQSDFPFASGGSDLGGYWGLECNVVKFCVLDYSCEAKCYELITIVA
jgi:RHS repeat-associated protein